MKKLLVLSIVIAMASVAGAGLYITAGSEGTGTDQGSMFGMPPGDITWLGIYAENMPDPGMFNAFILIVGDPCSHACVEWTGGNNVYIPPALEDAFNTYGGYEPSLGDIWFFQNATPLEVGADGLHADFEFQSTGRTDVTIELWNGDWDEILDTLTLMVFGWSSNIQVYPEEFTFTAIQGGANPADQILHISVGGDDSCILNWEVTETCDWLEANPTSGRVQQASEDNDDHVTLSVDISGLLPGVYDCNLTVLDIYGIAVNTPQIVPIELQVLERPGDFDEDGEVNCDDLRVLALAFMSKSGDDNWNPDCDISDPNDEVIDGQDFGVFAMDWDRCGDPPPEPGMSYNIEDCDLGAKSAAGDKNGLRFSVTVEGNHILFEDMMYANCCPDEMWLDMEVTDNQITIYEHAEGGLCDCMCDFPVSATLGPFNAGTYTLEVYEDIGGFIGSTVVIVP